MDDVRAELDSLEADLEAFLRARIEPGLSRAVELRLAEQARALGEELRTQLDAGAVRSDAVVRSQIQEIRALSEAIAEMRRDMAVLHERLAKLERRAQRAEATPHAEAEDDESGGLVAAIRRNPEYLAIGALAVAVIGLVVWVVFAFVLPPAAAPAAPPPAAAAGSAPAASSSLITVDPVDAGLNELAKRDSAIKAECGDKACAFGTLWPRLDVPKRQALIVAAAHLVSARCPPAHPGADLAAAWRAAVACSKVKDAPVLGAPKAWEPAARWILGWIGGHP